MRSRRVGQATVSAIGMGVMPTSIEGRGDEARSIRIAKALASYAGDASDVLVATKGGQLRPGDGSWTVDGSPAHLREATDASLKALGVDAIGLYQFHRPDPEVPYAESAGVLRESLHTTFREVAIAHEVSAQQVALAWMLAKAPAVIPTPLEPARGDYRLGQSGRSDPVRGGPRQARRGLSLALAGRACPAGLCPAGLPGRLAGPALSGRWGMIVV